MAVAEAAAAEAAAIKTSLRNGSGVPTCQESTAAALATATASAAAPTGDTSNFSSGGRYCSGTNVKALLIVATNSYDVPDSALEFIVTSHDCEEIIRSGQRDGSGPGCDTSTPAAAEARAIIPIPFSSSSREY